MALPEPTAERPEALPCSPQGKEKGDMSDLETPLLSDGTTTWTGKQETFRVLTMIENRALGRMKDGDSKERVLDGIRKPKCKSCSSVTSYVVENVTTIKHEDRKPCYMPVKLFVGFLMNQMQMCVYLDEKKTMLYIPVTLCHKCAGSKDGYHDGKFEPERRLETLARLDTAALTHTEKQEYRTAYEKSYDKGRQARREWDEENPPKKSRKRYQENH